MNFGLPSNRPNFGRIQWIRKEKAVEILGCILTIRMDRLLIMDTVPQWNDRLIRMDRLLRMDTVLRCYQPEGKKTNRREVRILGCKTY